MKLVSVSEAAELAYVSERTVRRWIEWGWLVPVWRSRRVWLVEMDVLIAERFARSRRSPGRPRKS